MVTQTKSIKELEELAAHTRKLTLDAIYKAASGHIGPAFSMTEILVALLFNQLNWNQFLPSIKKVSLEEQLNFWHNPELKRDRFVISKGHGVPSWYAALAIAGYIKPSELNTLRVINSRLQGHPERKRFPFIDATTGSLGQGQAESIGYALANKLNGRTEKVYCIIGDGESNEGQVWESALAAPKFKLDNLVYIIDFNKKQGEGTNKEIMDLEPLQEKWLAFNWHVQRIEGHDIAALVKAFEEIKGVKDKPHVIIADTKKGYLGNGELFMDGGHNPVIDEENYNLAVKFLDKLIS